MSNLDLKIKYFYQKIKNYNSLKNVIFYVQLGYTLYSLKIYFILEIYFFFQKILLSLI